MAFIMRHPANLPAKYYRAIGELIVKWNFVDFHMQSIARFYLNLGPKESRVLMYKLGTRDKVDILRAVCLRWVSDPVHKKKLEKITEKFHKLSNRRNEYIHGTWGHKIGAPRNELRMMYIRKAKEKILPLAPIIKPDDIQKIVSDLCGLGDRLVQFHKDVGAPLP